MAFFGRETVLADLRLHKEQAGAVTAGTLTLLGGAAVTYADVCLWPSTHQTGLGGPQVPLKTAQLTAWRHGEASAPRPDDSWTVGGVAYQIQSVTKRLHADESAGFCIYDCDVVRPE